MIDSGKESLTYPTPTPTPSSDALEGTKKKKLPVTLLSGFLVRYLLCSISFLYDGDG